MTGQVVHDLTERRPERRARRLPRRELVSEASASVLFVAAAAGLLALAPGTQDVHPAAFLVVLGHLLASRVEFPLGNGAVVPTQPFLVALFGLADAALVPWLVLLALVGSQLVDVARRRSHPERLLWTGGDAIHALAPAAVLLAAGTITPLVVVAAFVAQALVDLGASLVRDRAAHGVTPTVHVLVIARVWAVDLALLPLGVLAALTADEHPLAPLGLLPLVALLAGAARDREEQVDRAHDRLRALEAARGLAQTDELTGLANHRRFQELADTALARHDRDGTPVAVVLLDVDDFKQVNDLHGHATGDAVLRAVGAALRDACREGAEPARYGGEEFAVVLQNAGEAEAAACAERLRVAIAAIEVPGCPRVTASFGVAPLGRALSTKPAVIEAADEALYAAKAAGKDRVAVWQNARSACVTPGTVMV